MNANRFSALENPERLTGKLPQTFALRNPPGVGFYHPDAVQVLLNDVVQPVVGVEYPHKDWVHVGHDHPQSEAEDRDNCEKDQGQLRIDSKRKYQGEHNHHWGPDAETHQHLKSVLHVGDVGSQPGNDTCRRELVDIGKRKFLHIIEHIVAQVFRKSGRRDGRAAPRENAGQQ